MTKTVLILLGIFTALALACWAIVTRDHIMEDKLPPIVKIDRHEVNFLLLKDLDLVAIRGTGSMRPYIPEGDGVVAYAQIYRHIRPEDVRIGDLAIITTSRGLVCHQLVGKWPNGSWISAGTHNGSYDAGSITDERIYGIATKVYVINQPVRK